VSVAFDASVSLVLLFPNVPGPKDPATKKPVERCRERIDYLISELDEAHTKVIIPTPALSEILVYADKSAPQYLDQIRQSRAFKIGPFDERAAAEVAMMIRADLKQLGKKRGRQMRATWAKVKFDRQIVAIAKVNGVTTLYSDDVGVRSFAEDSRLPTLGIADLPLPASAAQITLDFRKQDASGEGSEVAQITHKRDET